MESEAAAAAPHPLLRPLALGRVLTLLAAAAVVFGVVARLVHFDDTLIGDELSTLYIVKDQSLGHVLSTVKSDAEISPPLYFVLAWFFGQFGSNPDLIRLPALIAGLASIPLAFLLARRLFGYSAGLVAAAVMALNPFMVFYATEARPYTLAIAFLLGSTLAMLIAAERRSVGWWVTYAALVALAMYSHYTAAFVLGAQLLWLLWARPQARAPALIATAGAALAYLPWVPGVLDDANSPTVKILSALQGNGIDVKLNAIANWAFGYPYQPTDRIPGQLWLVIGIVAFGLLVISGIAGLLRRYRPKLAGNDGELGRALVLAAALALATPLAEAVIVLAGGTDLFGARNLDLASGGGAVLIGGLAVLAGPVIAAAAVSALIAAFTVGTVKSLDAAYDVGDFKAAAAFIDENAGETDVVVDTESTILSPVPATPISVQMSGGERLFNLFQTAGPPPFLGLPPPPAPIFQNAARDARNGRLFLVGQRNRVAQTPDGVAVSLSGADVFRAVTGHAGQLPQGIVNLPGWRVTESRHFAGYLDVNVFVLTPPAA